MSSKRNIYIFAILTILITVFVFSNSIKDVESSRKDSRAVLEIIDSIVDTDSENTHSIVRKSAHFFEYILLGVVVIYLIKELKKHYKRIYLGYSCLYGIAIAGIDEYIQSFSDQSSSGEDVLIDFAGFL